MRAVVIEFLGQKRRVVKVSTLACGVRVDSSGSREWLYFARSELVGSEEQVLDGHERPSGERGVERL